MLKRILRGFCPCVNCTQTREVSMQAMRKRASFVRLFALIAVLSLVAAACTGDTADPTTTTAGDPDVTTAPDETTPDTPDDTSPDDTTPPPSVGDLDTYTLGIFQDMTTDNLWSLYDTSGSTVWNSYVLDPSSGSAYTVALPGLELVPDLAAGELAPTVQDGDAWVGEIVLKDGLAWSDGEPLTASDVAFTWATAVEFALAANWADFVDAEVVDSVEAIDDTTVQVTFNTEPGLGLWGLGVGVPLMPVMPEHFWADVVEEARASDDPATTLVAASGADAPAVGPTQFSERQEGSFAATTANDTYHDAGVERESGGVTWTEGPFADNFNFPLYGGQEAAVLALAQGEVDFLLNPLGMQRGFQDQVLGNDDLTAIVNQVNGFRFVAFNHSRAPMSDSAFRDAVAVLINKEFVTESLLQNIPYPLYSILPEGNTAWYDEAVSDEIAESQLAGADDDTRRAEALSILTDAGYSWATPPGWNTAEGDSYSTTPEEGLAFTPGEGLIDPDGNTVEQIEMLTPTASYDPFRATFGNYISGVAIEMGIPILALPTDFNKIIDDVFETDDNNEYTSDFDMFILGYSLGNAAFPSFHGAFFGTGGGSNNTQYSNAELDALVVQFDATQDLDEARDILWEMERLIARDKPHIPLFDTPILEFYNNAVDFPFTETLSGLQFISGAQTTVAAR
ncbi:ABC transporter substrate-binding protein [soil metagenome]